MAGGDATDSAGPPGKAPGESTVKTASVDHTALRYLVAGDGKPVVLVHGGGLDSAAVSWRATVPALAATHRLYAPNLPAYGRSDPPSATPTVAYYVGVLEQFIEQLDTEPVALVGISLGGAVALGTALDRPELVDRLVLVDCYGLGRRIPGGWLAALSVRIPGLMTLTWRLLARSRWLTAWSLRAIVHRDNLSHALVDEVYAVIREGTGGTWGAFQRAEVGIGGLRTDYSSRLPELDVPVLFAHGAADPLVSLAWAVRGATLAPVAELQVIERCGHWPPRERPATIDTALREFLG